jgi:drug/metabolite transporter (DMT)-like permease
VDLFWIGVVLFGNGMASGFLSKHVRNKTLPGYVFVFTSIIGFFCWWGMAQSTSRSLAYVSILFDVLIQGGYFVALVMLGEDLTALSLAGVALTMVGLGLMSLQG